MIDTFICVHYYIIIFLRCHYFLKNEILIKKINQKKVLGFENQNNIFIIRYTAVIVNLHILAQTLLKKKLLEIKEIF